MIFIDPTDKPSIKDYSMRHNHASRISQIAADLKVHKVSVSLFLATYGAVYLASVILTGWTVFDGAADVSGLPLLTYPGFLPRGAITPLFFVTSVPALFIGTVGLCLYCSRNINPQAITHEEHVAILLAVCGFAYVVVGAWPLQNRVDFAWEWQKGIVGSGLVFAWGLYLLGLGALAVGAVAVYRFSKIYHKKYLNPQP
ncbi:MAG: hypothetical protein NWE92_05730 [Candidatus Bathyarchaeota archaeon]|nr:hypothetical protein [Candidatus Bathyarchaeota archaeon]